MNPYLGMVIPVGFTFAPAGWLLCDGSLQAIANYEALFALLGTTYGGDGAQTFALPDLRGRTPIHQGQAPGLSAYSLGQAGGAANVTLLPANLPGHAHPLSCAAVTSSQSPAANFVATTNTPIFVPGPSNQNMGDLIDPAGGSQPHSNLQPYLVLNWIIATQGIFPSQT